MSTLSPQEFENVRVLFPRAIDLPVALREDFVRRAAGSDAECEEVLLLLEGEPDSAEVMADPLATAEDPILLGREQLPGYVILGILGRGGMGTVYHAEAQDTGEEVAIKVLRADRSGEQSEKRFRRECKALSTLKHANIARYIDSGQAVVGAQTRPFVVMEYVNGVSLREFVRRESLSLEGQVSLLAEAADAIAYSHDQGIVHRDLKPDNILVDENGRIKVVDFGVARIDASMTLSTFETVEGSLVGTFQYMSPEQVSGTDTGVAPNTDVYSLGVVAYEVLTGTPPYVVNDLSFPEMVVTILRARPSWDQKSSAQVPRHLRYVLELALTKESAKRYPTARAFADDLRRFLSNQTVHAHGIIRRALWWRRARVATIAVVILAGVGAAIALVGRGLQPDPVLQLSAMGTRIEQLDQRRHLEPLATEEIEALIPEYERAVIDLAQLSSEASAPQLKRYLWFRLGELHFFLGSRESSTIELTTAKNYWLLTRDASYDSLAVETLVGYDTLRNRMHQIGVHKPSMSVALVESAMSFYDTPLQNARDALKHRFDVWKRYAPRHGLNRDLLVAKPQNNEQVLEIGFFLNEIGHSRAQVGYLSGDVVEIDRGIALLDRVFAEDLLRWARGAVGSALRHAIEAYYARAVISRDTDDLVKALVIAEMAGEIVTKSSSLRAFASLQRLRAQCEAELIESSGKVEPSTICGALALVERDLDSSGATVQAALVRRDHARLLLARSIATADPDLLQRADSILSTVGVVLLNEDWPYQFALTSVMMGEIELAQWRVDGDPDRPAVVRSHAQAARLRIHAREDAVLARTIEALIQAGGTADD